MKLIYCTLSFVILSLLCFNGSYAQPYHWAWAQGDMGGNSLSQGLCTDNMGNVFSIGFSATFTDSIRFGNIVLSNFGSTGAVVVKYDPSGQLMWAKGTENGDVYPVAITCDDAGNLYLLGSYGTRSMTIGPFTLTQPDSLNTATFLAKYSSSGDVVWAENLALTGAALPSQDQPGGLAIYRGNIFLTTPICGRTVNFGGINLINNDTTGFNPDICVAKINLDGNVIWAKDFGGTGYDLPVGISVSPQGDIYVTGIYNSPTLDFQSTTLSSDGYHYENVFLTKMDNDGNPLFATSIVGNDVLVYSIGLDSKENVYICGEYFDTAIINSHNVLVSNTFVPASFLASYSANGDFNWNKSFYSPTRAVFNYSLTVDPCDNIWVSGGNNGNGPGYDTFSIYTGSEILHGLSSQCEPMYIAELSNNGSYIQGSVIESGGEHFNCIVADKIGNLYIAGGYYQNPSTVGPLTLTDTTVSTPFSWPDSGIAIGVACDMFVAKYASDNIIDTTKTVTSICVKDSVMLYAQQGFEAYEWYDTTGGDSHIFDDTGTYWVYCTGNCQTPVAIDTFHVVSGKLDLSFSLGDDTSVCGAYTLAVPVDGGSYLWQDGSTGSSFTVTTPGTYYVTVSGDGCTYTDSINIGLSCDSDLCNIIVPNAFTPNHDGLNDVFGPVIIECTFTDYAFSVYNRWGQRVFYTNDPLAKWDGTFLGVNAELDVYMYMVDYTDAITNVHHFKKGDITLVR